MKLRKMIVAGAALATASTMALASPSTAVDTSAYFTITGTGLAVSAPQPAEGVNLGSVASSDLLTGSPVVSGSLGAVTVNDGRGALVAAWTATVSSTEFVNEDAGAEVAANEKVALANISYLSGVATSTSGVGTFAPGAALTMDLLPALRVAGTWAGSGANSVTWNPTVTMTLLNSQVAGKYVGTITHSVA